MLMNRFMPTCTAKIDVNIEAVTTATPDDRSNSPPIISSATLTAITPMVALWYSTVAIAADERNGGAMIQKKMKIATAATSALSSGLVRISFSMTSAVCCCERVRPPATQLLELSHVLRCLRFDDG